MENCLRKNPNAFFYVAAAIILVVVFFQLVAIFKTPVVGDEPDDFMIAAVDLGSYQSFFNDSITTDQTRLPFFISMPFIYKLGDNALIPLRLIFLSFHLLYLFFCYKLIKLLTDNKTAAWLFALLIATSCFLTSFSIFSISTSDNLYLLFHIAAIYYFIKSYLEYRQSGFFPNYIWLSLIIALCIASKLFGVFLLIAFFIFFLVNQKEKTYVRANVKKLICYGLIFLFILWIINTAQLVAILKLFLAVIPSLVYLVIIVFDISKESRGALPKTEISWFEFWAVLTLTSFNLTLIFSPIYLNFNNIIKIFSWTSDWGWASGALTSNSHFYDIALIMLVKFGFLPLLLLLAVVLSLVYNQIKNKRIKFFNSVAFLFCLIFIVHLVIVSWPEHKVAWYPLAVFPFLYLPIIWAFLNVGKRRLLLYGCVAIIVVSNLARYFYWFPYGQFDGAQYGRNFIGYNRSGFVTSEFVPEIINYFKNIEDRKNIIVNFRVTKIPRFNFYLQAIAEKEIVKEDVPNITLVSLPLDEKNYNYIITSQADNFDIDKKNSLSNFIKVDTISWRGIGIANIWKKN